ncbi:MAG TPA: amidohydrolase [Xanthomonadales bacterium]|nr:amidohydrolase [Xanthomonadales bacterium]
MTRHRLTLAAIVAVAFPAHAALAAGSVGIVVADRVVTMDPARPYAEAFAFDDTGAIVAVGTQAGLAARYPGARTHDERGRVVLPGLIDAHGHVLGLGLGLMQAQLEGTTSKADVVARLQAFAKDLPNGEWLLGRGWDQNDWPEKRFPTAADLDAAFPDRPVWIERVDGHAAWANTAALKFVKKDLSGDWQPGGGRIEREGGKATGVFVDGAMNLVNEVVPVTSPETADRALGRAFEHLLAAGLTGVHDMGVSRETMALYRQRADEGRMPLRVVAYADGDGPALADLCAKGAYQHASQRLKMRGVKLYADGALGSRGAALLADYADDAGNKGLLVTDEAALNAAVDKAFGCKVQVATHAIGDRGNRVTLDAYARHLDGNAGDLRWRIEHAQVVALDDIRRFAKLGVIASMQPTHATSDMPWAEARVGPERILGGYAWRRMRDAGVRLAFGSDFPVEDVNPFWGLYSAVAREDADGKPAGGWYPDQRVTTHEALRGFTSDAAWAGFDEGTLGAIAPGRRADFVVVATDPFAVAPRALRDTKVLATWVDGKPAYTAK